MKCHRPAEDKRTLIFPVHSKRHLGVGLAFRPGIDVPGSVLKCRLIGAFVAILLVAILFPSTAVSQEFIFTGTDQTLTYTGQPPAYHMMETIQQGLENSNQWEVWLGINLRRGIGAYPYPDRWFIGMRDHTTNGTQNYLRINSSSATGLIISDTNGHVGVGMEPSGYALDVNGVIHSSNGVCDGTPWPNVTPETALDRVGAIRGKYARLSLKSDSETLVIDHESLPEGVRDVQRYDLNLEGSAEDLLEYAANHEMKILGEIQVTTGTARDGLTEVTYASAPVEKENRNLSAMVSYNVLALQALAKSRQSAENRLTGIEKTLRGFSSQSGAGAIGSKDTSTQAETGQANQVSGTDSVVVRGVRNEITGTSVTVLGSDNVCAGDSVLIAGSGNIVGPDAEDSYVFGDALDPLVIHSRHAALFFPANPDGRLAIGTANPVDGARLLVAGGDIRVIGGSFIADGKRLTTPDYVFEKDHQVMPIDDVDRYVSTHGRLPGFPSAAEVADQGVDVAQFQMKLLEKVEELTVYTIQQQQEIRALKAEVAALRDGRGAPKAGVD